MPERPGSLDPGVPSVDVTVDATAARVWEVLADGWVYTTWVVGASRVRAVDGTWPAEGASIHHSFGVWPAVVDDETRVVLSRPPSRLVLRARGRPLGEAVVDIRLEQAGDHRCTVSIAEDAVSGPGSLVPRAVRQLAITRRNTESLTRLRYLAERHDGEHVPAS